MLINLSSRLDGQRRAALALARYLHDSRQRERRRNFAHARARARTWLPSIFRWWPLLNFTLDSPKCKTILVCESNMKA